VVVYSIALRTVSLSIVGMFYQPSMLPWLVSSSVCSKRWLSKKLLCLNDMLQIVHLYGVSPLWVSSWRFSLDGVGSNLLQYWQIYILRPKPSLAINCLVTAIHRKCTGNLCVQTCTTSCTSVRFCVIIVSRDKSKTVLCAID